MVFICDGNLLDKVKPLIHNAKTTGEWDGDFVLMVPESVDTDVFDSDSTNNLIIYKVLKYYFDPLIGIYKCS